MTKIIGLPKGKKTKLVIPEMILNDDDLMKYFISGFFDTDGCIYTKKGRMSPYIKISQKSKIILDQIQKFLSKFGINAVFEYHKRTGVNEIVIYEKHSVFKFCKLIKSKHPYKLERINKFALSYPKPP